MGASAAAGFPAAGAAAGGGGGVAGGVLLLGVSALVVGAVVVGAVVLSQSDDDADSGPVSNPRESDRRGSIRRRISNLFGGVNVMNPAPGVHQSITARSPPVKV